MYSLIWKLFVIHYSFFTKNGRNLAMTESVMFTKSKAFALRIVRLYKYLRDAELVDGDKAFTSVCDDCTELLKLLTASVKTAKT